MKQIFGIVGTSFQQVWIGGEKTPADFGCDVEMQSERPADDSVAQADGTWL